MHMTERKRHSAPHLHPRTFSGETVDANSILLKYSWNGDADLNGTVNADDYAIIDAGHASHKAGYRNGDFDYGGGEGGSSVDYAIIDAAFANQSGTL